MKLKNKFPLIWSALLLIDIVGCSKSEPTVPVGESPYTLAIAVQGEASLQTRTSVFDPDDQTLKGRQHVTRVQQTKDWKPESRATLPSTKAIRMARITALLPWDLMIPIPGR